MNLCQMGFSTINERKEILDIQKKKLFAQMEQIQKSIDFIDEKQHYFDEVLEDNIAYKSNLINVK